MAGRRSARSAVSLLAAILLTLFGLELEGPAEQIFEGVTMLLAAGILTWMIFWMSQQARTSKPNSKRREQAAASTGRRAIFWLAFLAVLREGIELALFLTASRLCHATRLQTSPRRGPWAWARPSCSAGPSSPPPSAWTCAASSR